MTINVVLATYDGIVLGCDSLSSYLEWAILPGRGDLKYAVDENGAPLVDAKGRQVISVDTPRTQIPVNVFGGVTKMFEIYCDPAQETCVAAVTSGLALLSGLTIAQHAKNFRKRAPADLRKVSDVADHFLEYFRNLLDAELAKTPAGQRPAPELSFLVAGYGADDPVGEVYSLEVAHGRKVPQFTEDEHRTGLCWAGMANYVERLLHGVDARLALIATREMASAMATQRESFLEALSRGLVEKGVTLPDGLEIDVEEHTPPTLPWVHGAAPINYAALSIQYAVELVELLVNTQSGMQRFEMSIPTVGGRTHIGVLRRGEALRVLNEPDLEHKHTGYSYDY